MSVLLTLLVLGCGKPDVPTLSGPPTAALTTCRSPEDCALSNLRSADDCCGDPCEAGQAYLRDELTALRTARDATCATKDVSCPQADCNPPTNFYPGCDHGTCVAIALPPRTTCTTDEQCVLSCYEPGACCGSCNCGTPWHRDDLASAEKWRSEQCGSAGCPLKKCAANNDVARCDKGWCVAK